MRTSGPETDIRPARKICEGKGRKAKPEIVCTPTFLSILKPNINEKLTPQKTHPSKAKPGLVKGPHLNPGSNSKLKNQGTSEREKDKGLQFSEELRLQKGHKCETQPSDFCSISPQVLTPEEDQFGADQV